MSVGIDDGRRSKRGSARSRVGEVHAYVSNHLPLYVEVPRLDVKRSFFGKRLYAQVTHKDAADCPK